MSTLYLLVGVDVEPDHPWAARTESPPDLTNVRTLPALHDRLTRHGVRPTYLVTLPVATDPSTAAIIRDLHATGSCEVGVRHDPSDTPGDQPLDGRRTDAAPGVRDKRFPEQLERLTDAVESVTHTAPISYRGTRSAFSAAHVSVLERMGYTVASTVTPWRMEWRRGSSFPGTPLAPYYLSYDDVCRPGSSDVLEIPTSCLWSRTVPGWLARPMAYMTRLPVVERLMRASGAAHLVELRPASSSLRDMTDAARRLLREPPHVLNVVCASSDGVVGGSPQNVSDAQLTRFFDRLESFLRFVTEELDAVPLTFGEFRTQWCSPRLEPLASAAERSSRRPGSAAIGR